MKFNDHPKIRLLRVYHNRPPGFETSDFPFGVTEELVRRGVAEYVKNEIETESAARKQTKRTVAPTKVV